MRIEYICHASLAIEVGRVTIVTDPWLRESAYAGQWHLFPKPVSAERAQSANVILLSHGHEDHLHPPTLETLPKSADVFYPFNWYTSVKEYLGELGFSRFHEAVTGRRYPLADDVFVTYLANNLDSIIVIEGDGKVFVDVNDALHAHHPRVIDLFVEHILRRWPRIDTVFCGFGGASYFPNTIHVAGKDDEMIGRLREQFFVHNFCRIVAGLRPHVAVPFAADFALLEPNKDWMNRIRFPRTKIADYFREQFPDAASQTTIHAMFPGDVLDDDVLRSSSPYHSELREGDLQHLIAEQYATEIAACSEPKMISDQSAEALAEEILKNLVDRATLFPAKLLDTLRFCLRVTDVAANGHYHVRFKNGSPNIERSGGPSADEMLVISISSLILRYSFASTWGGDAITIGYAADIQILDRKVLTQKLDAVCVRLLTRHPSASRHMLKQPLRAARFLFDNPLTRKWAVRRLMHRDNLDATYDANLWLARTKCEVCQVCDIPLLDAHFSSTL